MSETLLDEVVQRLKPQVDLPNITFGFVIDETETYVIAVVDGRPTITHASFLPPNRVVTIYVNGAVLSDIINGRIDPMVAALTRKLRVAGPFSEARKLAQLFQ